MTEEEKRARHRTYMREWRKANKAKESEYRMATRRRRALRELLDEKKDMEVDNYEQGR